MGNETQGVDYSAVLADLEARKAQIDSAISVIKALMTTGLPPAPAVTPAPATAVPPAPPGNGSLPFEIQSDTFFGLSILDASKKFLAMRKRPVSAPEILDALRRGGQLHANNETFLNTLGATLSRSDAKNGPLVRVSRGMWGLRDWYANKSSRASSETE